ncbi:aspartate carbamoyltransferase catalytic subunit [Marinicella sp. S1101]|uniref:aspartate carbamoyltransferase catalytic subunit n=1 Tax=Marinicella marina TaxID=2996016 RepID=UPI0022609DF0|nr:aspartate carbamoyltransferase catalytic subunit [Marinicella marina]MCX7554603.1 aspartate carbamoyltransferase catalytic subunit [Marinicella marina]
MKHLTDIKSLSKSTILELFASAEKISASDITATKKWHPGKSAIALFFENSTRTLASFQLACQRLGVDVTALNVAHSSTQKGETIKDTVLTLNAMQPDLFIVRHHENHIQDKIVDWIGQETGVINAGDGSHQHPTQGLLDLFTIWQHKQQFDDLKVTIIGDIKHSRVANSLIDGLQLMQTKEVVVYGPDALIPEQLNALKASNMKSALCDADVVVMLRIQKERLPKDTHVDFSQWHQQYGLNSENLKAAKANAIVMHPGPMNRGIEITDRVADGEQSVILQQVRNGVLMRQAIIHRMLEL